MESYGNVFDEEWVNLGSMFFCDQDSNHFTNHGLFSSEHDHNGFMNLETPATLNFPCANESVSSSSCIIDDQILAYTSDDHDIKSDFCNYFSQDSSNITMDGDASNFLFLSQIFSGDTMEEIHCLKQDEGVDHRGKMGNSVGQPMTIADLGKVTHLKRKYELLELPIAFEEGNIKKKNDKKKTRVSNDHNKNKKSLPPKKIQKKMTSLNRNEDDGEENRYNNVQSSSSCSSDDHDSNASQDLNGRETATEKTRAGRGAATDPQSIYARKRRERINERLRTLQTLVPNGTKVDISTMLEEAVHYVKFLQLQINLLSSDDKWMYAPIAYNGVDMGLYKTLI